MAGQTHDSVSRGAPGRAGQTQRQDGSRTGSPHYCLASSPLGLLAPPKPTWPRGTETRKLDREPTQVPMMPINSAGTFLPRQAKRHDARHAYEGGNAKHGW